MHRVKISQAETGGKRIFLETNNCLSMYIDINLCRRTVRKNSLSRVTRRSIAGVLFRSNPGQNRCHTSILRSRNQNNG